jgi:hypothetical protein
MFNHTGGARRRIPLASSSGLPAPFFKLILLVSRKVRKRKKHLFMTKACSS